MQYQLYQNPGKAGIPGMKKNKVVACPRLAISDHEMEPNEQR